MMGSQAGSAAAAASERGGDPMATRETLTRVLAVESRNALSRVELAADELTRLATNPAIQARLSGIREAVGELDVLLEKLALLWTARVAGEVQVVDLEALVEGVCERIAPTLQARGIPLERRSRVGRCRLGITPIRVERLLLCLLRLGIGSVAGEEGLRLETRVEGEGIGVLLARSGDPDERDGALWRATDATRRLELELQLAELGGRLSQPVGEEPLALWIPGCGEVDA